MAIAMLQFFKRTLTFIELMIGLFLPWKLRCKYSELLQRLDNGIPAYITSRITEDKQRNFERHLQLGNSYLKEGELDKAIENLNQALELDPHNRGAIDIHHLLSICYKHKNETEKYIESIVNLYQVNKKGKRKS